MSEMSTYLYLKMSVFYEFDPKTVDLVNVKTERNVQLQIETLLKEEMQEDLSPEDSEFLENLRTHLNWDEYWSGEWEVSVSPVSNAYLSVDKSSKEEIQNRYLNPSEYTDELESDSLVTDHITFEIDDLEDCYFTPSCTVKNVKLRCGGVANM